MARFSPLPTDDLESPRLTGVASVALVAVVVVVVVAVASWAVRSNQRQQELSDRNEAREAVVALEDRMATYEEVLFGLRAALTSSEPGFADFNQQVTALEVDDRLPGVQVLGVAALVPAAELPAWEQSTAAEAAASGLPYPGLDVHPDPDSGEALVIARVEPQAGNEAAFGLDFFSEANRRDAAERARDTGQPAATAPIRLVQETGDQTAFLLMVPLYGPGADVSTVDARRDAFTGVVYAAFRTGDLVDGVYGDRPSNVALITDAGSGEPLFAGGDGSEATVDETLDVGGRTWDVVVETTPALTGLQRATPWIVVAGGVALLVLLLVLGNLWVSNRRRAVELAESMLEELDAMAEAASEAIVTIDHTGRIVAWNRGATEIFGQGEDEMIGQPLDLVSPPALRAPMHELIDGLVAGAVDPASMRSWRSTAQRGDGTEFPVELSVSRWEGRGQVFITGFLRDRTEQQRVEAERQATSQLLAAVLESATEVSVIATDVSGTIIVFNRGAERLLRQRASDVVGRSTPEAIHDPDEVVERAAELGIEPGFEVFVHAARHGQPETRRWTYVRADGTRVPVELTVTAMEDRSGEITGFIGIATDITARRAQEEAQAHALEVERDLVEKLRELDRSKSDFVSTASHELRTPLTSIVGFSEILADHVEDDESASELVGVIERNAHRLLGLVEDLLVLSRMESGAFRMRREPCDLGPAIQAVAEDIGPLASPRRIEVVTEVEADLPRLVADRPQLERALLNVLSNAVKFSSDGSVVRVRGRVEGSVVVVEVEDHGVGIPADEQDRLFTRFFRARTAEQRSGTGLGLAIVAGIVERHHGTVSISSEEGVGTTVTIRLPADPAPHRPLQGARP